MDSIIRLSESQFLLFLSSKADTMRPPPVLRLDEDSFLEVAQWIEVQDILCLRQTCTTLSQLSRLRSLWYRQFVIVSERVTVPPFDRHISELAASELETLVVRLVRLERNWGHPSPSPSVSRPLPVPFTHDPLSVTEIVLLPGGRYLICAFEDGQILCWDLETSSHPWMVGQWGPGESQVNWSDPVIEGLGAIFTQDRAHIVVYALYECTDNETNEQHSSIIVWVFPTETISSMRPTYQPFTSFHFLEPQLCVDLQSWVLACASSEHIRIIDWQNATTTRVRQGVLQAGLHLRPMLKALPSLLVFCSRYECMLFALPPMDRLHVVESVDNIEPCIIASMLLWAFSLDPAIHGLIRSLSLNPDPIISADTHHYGSFPLPNPIYVRTDRFLVKFSFQHSISTLPALGSTISVHSYPLPFPLTDPFSLVYVGRSANRAIWLQPVDGGHTSILRLVVIKHMTFSQVSFQQAGRSLDGESSVASGRPLDRAIAAVLDEATGRVCIGSSHSLTLYDFSPLPSYELTM